MAKNSVVEGTTCAIGDPALPPGQFMKNMEQGMKYGNDNFKRTLISRFLVLGVFIAASYLLSNII